MSEWKDYCKITSSKELLVGREYLLQVEGVEWVNIVSGIFHVYAGGEESCFKDVISGREVRCVRKYKLKGGVSDEQT